MHNLANDLTHVLLVEDDLEICRLLAMFLQSKNYRVSMSHSGRQGLADIKRLQPDIVVLDIMLPELSGIEICNQCRSDYAGPILMLTACSEDMLEISALDSGADGYLHKPIRPHVLLSHIEAVLRRIDAQKNNVIANRNNGLNIDLVQRTVSLNGDALAITGSEYEFLAYLVERAGTIVSRDECYQALKGMEFDGTDRALDMRLSSLRKKIKDDVPPYQILKTIRGKGYLYIPEKTI